MISAKVLASGTGGTPNTAQGIVLEWRDDFLDCPDPLSGAIVYDRHQSSLFKVAFTVEHGANALLMAEGGKNYHPLILASEAGLPAIAGIGQLNELAGRLVTVDAGTGHVYEGVSVPSPEVSAGNGVKIPVRAPAVWVNVGYPSGLRKAADSGAAGIGLLRTEFAAVKMLTLHLNERLDDGRTWRTLLAEKDSSEADAIYTIAHDSRTRRWLKEQFRQVIVEAVECFAPRKVIVRTLDIARRLDEPMGNRGIRRCVGSGGETIRLLCQALSEVLASGQAELGLILPLVSHYSQISATVKILLETGLNLKRTTSATPKQITFGWEIEQPAASQNNALWLAAFNAEFGQPPHMIGIGTNDLTQFTIALGRDVHAEEKSHEMAKYLGELYDERDFSVVRQIIESVWQCRKWGTQVFVLGQAGADPLIAPLLFAYQVTPSVAAARVREVQTMATASLREGAKQETISAYKARVLEHYPSAVRAAVEQELDAFFAYHSP
jgi:phosphoenolpyruvate-protein kinase (PTS system EI component)